MNKREAKKKAHRAAWRLLQNGIDTGDIDDWIEDSCDADGCKVCDAFEELIQRHFEMSDAD